MQGVSPLLLATPPAPFVSLVSDSRWAHPLMNLLCQANAAAITTTYGPTPVPAPRFHFEVFPLSHAFPRRAHSHADAPEAYHPVGILKSDWLEKHHNRIPAVGVLVFETDVRQRSADWAALETTIMETIGDLRGILTRDRGVEIHVVLVQDNTTATTQPPVAAAAPAPLPPTASPGLRGVPGGGVWDARAIMDAAQERAQALRRRLAADGSAAVGVTLLFSSDFSSSPQQQQQQQPSNSAPATLLAQFEGTLRERTYRHYAWQTTRLKRVLARLDAAAAIANTAPSSAGGAIASRSTPAPSAAYRCRVAFKIGHFQEFRLRPHKALKYYSLAYRALCEVPASSPSSPCAEAQQLRAVAEAVNLKIALHCLMHGQGPLTTPAGVTGLSAPQAAVLHFQHHMRTWEASAAAVGDPALLPLHLGWLSRQHLLMGELLQQHMPRPTSDTKTQFLPCHYYHTAALYAVKRRRAAEALGIAQPCTLEADAEAVLAALAAAGDDAAACAAIAAPPAVLLEAKPTAALVAAQAEAARSTLLPPAHLGSWPRISSTAGAAAASRAAADTAAAAPVVAGSGGGGAAATATAGDAATAASEHADAADPLSAMSRLSARIAAAPVAAASVPESAAAFEPSAPGAAAAFTPSALARADAVFAALYAHLIVGEGRVRHSEAAVALFEKAQGLSVGDAGAGSMARIASQLRQLLLKAAGGGGLIEALRTAPPALLPQVAHVLPPPPLDASAAAVDVTPLAFTADAALRTLPPTGAGAAAVDLHLAQALDGVFTPLLGADASHARIARQWAVGEELCALGGSRSLDVALHLLLPVAEAYRRRGWWQLLSRVLTRLRPLAVVLRQWRLFQLCTLQLLEPCCHNNASTPAALFAQLQLAMRSLLPLMPGGAGAPVGVLRYNVALNAPLRPFRHAEGSLALADCTGMPQSPEGVKPLRRLPSSPLPVHMTALQRAPLAPLLSATAVFSRRAAFRPLPGSSRAFGSTAPGFGAAEVDTSAADTGTGLVCVRVIVSSNLPAVVTLTQLVVRFAHFAGGAVPSLALPVVVAGSSLPDGQVLHRRRGSSVAATDASASRARARSGSVGGTSLRSIGDLQRHLQMHADDPSSQAVLLAGAVGAASSVRQPSSPFDAVIAHSGSGAVTPGAYVAAAADAFGVQTVWPPIAAPAAPGGAATAYADLTIPAQGSIAVDYWVQPPSGPSALLVLDAASGHTGVDGGSRGRDPLLHSLLYGSVHPTPAAPRAVAEPLNTSDAVLGVPLSLSGARLDGGQPGSLPLDYACTDPIAVAASGGALPVDVNVLARGMSLLCVQPGDKEQSGARCASSHRVAVGLGVSRVATASKGQHGVENGGNIAWSHSDAAVFTETAVCTSVTALWSPVGTDAALSFNIPPTVLASDTSADSSAGQTKPLRRQPSVSHVCLLQSYLPEGATVAASTSGAFHSALSLSPARPSSHVSVSCNGCVDAPVPIPPSSFLRLLAPNDPSTHRAPGDAASRSPDLASVTANPRVYNLPFGLSLTPVSLSVISPPASASGAKWMVVPEVHTVSTALDDDTAALPSIFVSPGALLLSTDGAVRAARELQGPINRESAPVSDYALVPWAAVAAHAVGLMLAVADDGRLHTGDALFVRCATGTALRPHLRCVLSASIITPAAVPSKGESLRAVLVHHTLIQFWPALSVATSQHALLSGQAVAAGGPPRRAHDAALLMDAAVAGCASAGWKPLTLDLSTLQGIPRPPQALLDAADDLANMFASLNGADEEPTAQAASTTAAPDCVGSVCAGAVFTVNVLVKVASPLPILITSLRFSHAASNAGSPCTLMSTDAELRRALLGAAAEVDQQQTLQQSLDLPSLPRGLRLPPASATVASSSSDNGRLCVPGDFIVVPLSFRAPNAAHALAALGQLEASWCLAAAPPAGAPNAIAQQLLPIGSVAVSSENIAAAVWAPSQGALGVSSLLRLRVRNRGCSSQTLQCAIDHPSVQAALQQQRASGPQSAPVVPVGLPLTVGGPLPLVNFALGPGEETVLEWDCMPHKRGCIPLPAVTLRVLAESATDAKDQQQSAAAAATASQLALAAAIAGAASPVEALLACAACANQTPLSSSAATQITATYQAVSALQPLLAATGSFPAAAAAAAAIASDQLSGGKPVAASLRPYLPAAAVRGPLPLPPPAWSLREPPLCVVGGPLPPAGGVRWQPLLPMLVD